MVMKAVQQVSHVFLVVRRSPKRSKLIPRPAFYSSSSTSTGLLHLARPTEETTWMCS